MTKLALRVLCFVQAFVFILCSSLARASTPAPSESSPQQTQRRLLPAAQSRLNIDRMIRGSDAPETPFILRQYARGGDVSGGGFGLELRDSNQMIFFDLWVENRRYTYQPDPLLQSQSLLPSSLTDHELLFGWPTRLSTAAPRELATALERVRAWRDFAPELMDKLIEILQAQEGIWHATLLTPNDNPFDQFEFPGSQQAKDRFLARFRPVQVGKVDRFSGRIYLSSAHWDRMDLKSRAGLLIHEALRRLYLQTNRAYLSPSILQWMTGAIMFRSPALRASDSTMAIDRRMIETFYEEMIIDLGGTSTLEARRPTGWRASLCRDRVELANQTREQLARSPLFSDASATETQSLICRLQTRLNEMDQTGTSWIGLGSYRNLPSACELSSLNEMPSRTLTYWMQKSLGVGTSWTEAPPNSTLSIRPTRDLPAILRSESSPLSRAAYDVVIARFLEIGQRYCSTRDDFFRTGLEFVTLADVLLETAMRFETVELGPEFVASFKDPRLSLDLIPEHLRARLVANYESIKNTSPEVFSPREAPRPVRVQRNGSQTPNR